jgi:thioredoxin reductase
MTKQADGEKQKIENKDDGATMEENKVEPVSVAVIGCGPGGMFFCHAMEQKMKESPTGQSYSVSCFERSSQPGGVWRKADTKNTASADAVEMYDNLWTNGSAFNMEFSDYTFEEHFGTKPVTVYMKRQDVLEYITGRVTKHCPNFFEKYAQFETEVIHVVFDQATQKFNVTTKDLKMGKTKTKHFDKCLWACGDNGVQKMPKNLVDMFRKGGFKGNIIHSADSARLEEHVRGKRILLIGGGYSAEDLALQSIKLGVKKVYCVARSRECEVFSMKCWPGDKVDILIEQQPIGVTEGGRCIQFQKVDWVWPDKYEKADGAADVEREIRNIETIIFCTGYNRAIGMLDEELQKGIRHQNHELLVPEDWVMPDNPLTNLTGPVKPGKCIYFDSWAKRYRGVLVSSVS